MNPPAVTYTLEEFQAMEAIQRRIPGWSGMPQYAFFKTMLAAHPRLETMLILGVYHGRDIAFILDILARNHAGRLVQIVGVDRFSDQPCADWPRWATSWEMLTKGMPAPNLTAAAANVGAHNVTLVQANDATFLEQPNLRFGLVYLDTSHDYASVKNLLAKVWRVCTDNAIICGDDFSNANGWGVKTAVEESFTSFDLLGEWVWYSDLARLKA